MGLESRAPTLAQGILLARPFSVASCGLDPPLSSTIEVYFFLLFLFLPSAKEKKRKKEAAGVLGESLANSCILQVCDPLAKVVAKET